MTVEERAKTVTDEVGIATTGAELRALIAQALRDQIEECAKVADKYEQSEKEEADRFRRRKEPIPQATHVIMSVVCMRLGRDIRALAGEKREGGER